MTNNDNHIDELIAKYVAGEATPDETSFVDAWILKHDDNRKYFHQLQLIFNSTQQSSVQSFNTDAAWNSVKKKLEAKKVKTIAFEPSHTNRSLLLKIAASIIVIAAVAYLFFAKSKTSTTVDVITASQTEEDTLPDGSNVFLNKATHLAYSFDKKKNTHVVHLTGEAYFNIHRKDEKEFVIDAGGVFIKDIGTSFNVKAYPDSSLVEVVVEEGEVMFFTDTDSGLYLKKDGRGVFDRKTKQFSIAQPDINATAYKTKSFSFKDSDLLTVVNTLNRIYPTKIVIDKKITNCRITVNFDDDEIEEIADIIAETLNLSVTKNGNEIQLSGPGCDAQ